MPEQEQILQLGGMTENIIARLSERFTLVKLSDQPDRAAFLAAEGPAFAAAVTGGRLPPDVMEAAPNLKLVSSFGVGYDGIDARAAAERGIIVTHTPRVI